jgi:hypothetical protein
MKKTQELLEPVLTREITVDYPKSKECITSPEYTFRISAASDGPVEISIDGNEWQACRKSGGYWWCDWSGYMSGNHQAVCRIAPHNDGQKMTSKPRLFSVKLA